MRPEKYGIYYWCNDDIGKKLSYNILMLMTEKRINGKNFNIFLKTLYDKFVVKYPNKAVKLGEYAYSEDGDKMELSCINRRIYFTDNQFIIEDYTDPKDVSKSEFDIKQENNIDIVDRIEMAWNEIVKLVENKP